MSKVFTCTKCSQRYSHQEFTQSRFCKSCGTFRRLQIIESEKIKVKDDSWERWKRDVEEFRTIVPCEGQKYRWLIRVFRESHFQDYVH